MLQKVREAEREKVVLQFKNQNNQLVNGTVKRVTRDNIIVDIAYDAEAILPRDRLCQVKYIKLMTEYELFFKFKKLKAEVHN